MESGRTHGHQARKNHQSPRYDVQWRLPDHSKRKKTFKGAEPHDKQQHR